MEEEFGRRKAVRSGGRRNVRLLWVLCLNGKCSNLPVFRRCLREPDCHLLENKNALIESEWRQFVLIMGEIIK